MTLEILYSDALSPVRHGFFTRKGGASSGVFRGLNCGQGSSDQSDIVAINRDRVAKAMNAGGTGLTTVYQVHSADVVTVTSDSDLSGAKADGLVTATPGVTLGVLTADCQPVLFADPENGVIGAAHAGWRGALDGVIEATVDAMVALGAKREAINAAIGPTISQRAYEVGPEFLDRFLQEDPDYARFFTDGDGDKAQFDLPSFGLFCLNKAGVGTAEWIGHCTYSDPDRFYSFRRSTHQGEADYGRLISAIGL
ncbi:peptidoglycan editing factor PgeF [Actibacterium pelagium]|uniref:Purine nucleoside phosphorylase n=1 Tax=Actibacterium pelagium TaxID=2029103 RepID=A0A917AKM5_9RHOB|nr:peptidoglycan editing factor PgeF [Actibacterium pelagium]GGE59230.1 laccase domain protein [Actibacterium pelagium]